jgi:hypothetical protein
MNQTQYKNRHFKFCQNWLSCLIVCSLKRNKLTIMNHNPMSEKRLNGHHVAPSRVKTCTHFAASHLNTRTSFGTNMAPAAPSYRVQTKNCVWLVRLSVSAYNVSQTIKICAPYVSRIKQWPTTTQMKGTHACVTNLCIIHCYLATLTCLRAVVTFWAE